MIEKYLYWLNSKDPNSDKETVFREMYSRIGYIFHIIQMIEYNITNILALEEFEKEPEDVLSKDDIERIRKNIDVKFNELSKLTFGNLKNKIEKSKYLANVDIVQLKKIVDYRNYLAHRCFKENLLNSELSTIEDVDKFVDELSEFEATVIDFNEWLLEVFNKNKIKRVWIIKQRNDSLYHKE